MLHSSTSAPVGSILGFLATSLKPNNSSNGNKPLGKHYPLTKVFQTLLSLDKFQAILIYLHLYLHEYLHMNYLIDFIH